MSNRTAVAALVLAAFAVTATAAAHQTTTSNGVRVTMHVTPDDEPIAGRSSTITVTKVRASRATFSWKRCRCRLKVTDSNGQVLLARRMSSKRTRFTFPRKSAYRLVFSGRVKRKSNGRYRSFAAPFSIRAY